MLSCPVNAEIERTLTVMEAKILDRALGLAVQFCRERMEVTVLSLCSVVKNREASLAWLLASLPGALSCSRSVMCCISGAEASDHGRCRPVLPSRQGASPV